MNSFRYCSVEYIAGDASPMQAARRAVAGLDRSARQAVYQVVRRSSAAALLFLGATPVTAQQPVASAPRAALVFDGVTVVDVEQGTLRPNQRVVITGARIQRAGSASAVPVPAGAQVIDARGKYLIPGLWDMHVHTDDQSRDWYPRFIAHGVTGIREMAQRFPGGADSFRLARRDIAAGTRVGPRLPGPSADLTHEVASDAGHEAYANGIDIQITIRTPEDAHRIIDSLKAEGMAFLKYHDDWGEPALYYAMLREARRVGLPFVGHIPEKITAADAADSGQRSIEHLGENRPCWSELYNQATRSDTLADTAANAGAHAGTDAIAPAAGDSVPAGCAAMVAAYLRNGTWITPTIVVSNGTSYEDHHGDGHRLIQTMHRLGFRRFLAGTDVGFGTSLVPGVSLLQEVVFLNRAGLTPLEALQAATLHPAQFFAATDSLGTVAAGKLADLVLLDGNPLEDIYRVLQPRAVVANGRYFDRAALDAMDPVGSAILEGFIAMRPPPGVAP